MSFLSGELFSDFDSQRRCDLGALPSPLWGGAGGGGGACAFASAADSQPPPSPTLPHKGGGSRPSLPLALISLSGQHGARAAEPPHPSSCRILRVAC